MSSQKEAEDDGRKATMQISTKSKRGGGELAFQPKDCGLETDGFFNNAGAGFDTKALHRTLGGHGIIANVRPNPKNAEMKENYSFDEELYKERFVIGRTNVRMDGFSSVLTRFDTTVSFFGGLSRFPSGFLKNHKSQKFK